mmetsp:Transcript_21575/g.54470  ORF Transcript_21575/g.54470 Transcript_21575/m.54470 type:complete len:175 (+) Transcript_21575:231-755(+)
MAKVLHFPQEGGGGGGGAAAPAAMKSCGVGVDAGAGAGGASSSSGSSSSAAVVAAPAASAASSSSSSSSAGIGAPTGKRRPEEDAHHPVGPTSSAVTSSSTPGARSDKDVDARHTNSSQFFICFEDLPDLNGKNVAFGKILPGSETCLELVRNVGSETGSTTKPVFISMCGQLR